MSLIGSTLASGPTIDASRWEHHRINVRPEVSTADAGGEPGISLHVVTCEPPPTVARKGTILLIHGFPETWYQFRHVITPLADAGYRVLAPDYRGAGDSTKPSQAEAVFTKEIMAQELFALTEKLGVKDPIHVVGHDIGGMIAHAYAVQYPTHTASVCWGECPLPGSQFYHTHKASPLLWHFVFHSVPDLPELLITPHIPQYLKHFYDRLSYNSIAHTAADLAVYTAAYSGAGALRCGLNVYRAFERDGERNVRWVREEGKSKVRCLALWGEHSFAGREEALGMCAEFYEGAEFAAVNSSGHWIAEEQPKEFVEKVLAWVGRE